MARTPVDSRIQAIAQTLTGRARILVDIIIRKGSATMEDITAKGYAHAARAPGDVRDAGIPLVTTIVKSKKTGRRMAVYSFGDPAAVVDGRFAGRATIPKNVKKRLVLRDGERCAACLHPYAARELQVDHSVPFRVGGDPATDAGFALLCRSCQRSKSWSCEHCPNWEKRKASVCSTCFWAAPARYSHVATRQERRVTLVFTALAEIRQVDAMSTDAAKQGIGVDELIRRRVTSARS